MRDMIAGKNHCYPLRNPLMSDQSATEEKLPYKKMMNPLEPFGGEGF